MERRSYRRSVTSRMASVAAEGIRLNMHMGLEEVDNKNKSIQTITSPRISPKTLSGARQEFLDHIMVFLKDQTPENKEALYISSKRLIFKTLAKDKTAAAIVARFGKDKELLANIFNQMEKSGANISREDWRKIRAAVFKNDKLLSRASITSTDTGSTGTYNSSYKKLAEFGNETKNNTYGDSIRDIRSDNEANNNIADTNDVQEKNSGSAMSGNVEGTKSQSTTKVQSSPTLVDSTRQSAVPCDRRETVYETASDETENFIHISKAIWGVLKTEQTTTEDLEQCDFWGDEKEEEEEPYELLAQNLKKALDEEVIFAPESGEETESSEERDQTFNYEFERKSEVAFSEIIPGGNANEYTKLNYNKDKLIVNEVVAQDGKFVCLEYDKSGEVLFIVQFDEEGNELSRFNCMSSKQSSRENFLHSLKGRFKDRMKGIIRGKNFSFQSATKSESDYARAPSPTPSKSGTPGASQTQVSGSASATDSSSETLSYENWKRREDRYVSYADASSVEGTITDDEALMASESEATPKRFKDDSDLQKGTGEDMDQPKVTDREVEQPKVTDREVDQPKVTDREVEQPKVADREVEKTNVTDGEVEQPKVTDREVEQPKVTDREVDQPKVTDREANGHGSTTSPSTGLRMETRKIDEADKKKFTKSFQTKKNQRLSGSAKSITSQEKGNFSKVDVDNTIIESPENLRELGNIRVEESEWSSKQKEKLDRESKTSSILNEIIPHQVIEEGTYQSIVSERIPEIEEKSSVKSDEIVVEKKSIGKDILDPLYKKESWKPTEEADVNKYLASHQIYELFQFMIADLVYVKPENPLDYLIDITRAINKSNQLQTSKDTSHSLG